MVHHWKDYRLCDSGVSNTGSQSQYDGSSGQLELPACVGFYAEFGFAILLHFMSKPNAHIKHSSSAEGILSLM
jgi:hypothetical protein